MPWKLECFLLSEILFWPLKLLLSCLIVKSEAAPLPGDARLLPWSHNILAADVASMYTCHSGLLAQMWLAGSGSDTGSLPAATPTWRSAHTQRVLAALRPARAWPWRPRVTGLRVSAASALAGVRGGRAQRPRCCTRILGKLER